MAKNEANNRFTVDPIPTVADLDDRLTEPSVDLVEAMTQLEGDIVILGVGGKMGPTLARLAVRALRRAGTTQEVIGVSSFSKSGLRTKLEGHGIETIKADLLESGAVEALPDAPNIIYMVGRKFGSTGAEWDTWATNVYVAGTVVRKYQHARIVAFSSGNVYPQEPVGSGGSTECTQPRPVGEYAMSCLGRERMFDHAAHNFGTKVLHYRLNYATELRYGVLVDIAQSVWAGQPVDVTMGQANVVWQGYANEVALRSLALASSPPRILNVAGPETVSIRWAAARFAALMGKEAKIVGEEKPKAFLNNALECHKRFGYPSASVDTMIEWVAQWIMNGGETLDKPTHFQTSDGTY
jgi:hypothetical protein